MDVTFVLPTTTMANDTDKNRLRELLRTQALAVIISAYLDHAARVNQSNADPALRFNAAELVALINDVRAALVA